jgi:hypothetical protein
MADVPDSPDAPFAIDHRTVLPVARSSRERALLFAQRDIERELCAFPRPIR